MNKILIGSAALILFQIMSISAMGYVNPQTLSDWRLNPYMPDGYINTFHLLNEYGQDNGNLVPGLGIQNRPINGYLSLNILTDSDHPINPYYPQGYLVTILRANN